MSLVQLFLEQVNSTGVTLNERFGNLGTVVTRPGVGNVQPAQTVTARIPPPPSAKSVQLVEMLRRKATTRLAMNLLRKSIRTRLGLRGNPRLGLRSGANTTNRVSVQARLGLPLKGRLRRFRGRGRAVGLSRASSMQSLKRAGGGMQSQNMGGAFIRGRSRSRGRSLSRKRQQSRSRSRGPLVGFDANQVTQVRRGRSRSRVINQQGQQGARARSRSRSRVANGDIIAGANGIGAMRRGRPRGRGRGGAASGRVAAAAGGAFHARSRSRSRPAGAVNHRRGRGGGRGMRGRKEPPPSKDELDKQLDQYMSGNQEGESTVKGTAMEISWP